MSLPRYPRYKDSGVEWLGEVPEHWEVSKLGYESWVRARLGWKGLKAEEYVDDGFVFLSTPNIKGAVIDFENVNFITEDRYLESPEIALREGDVLLAKDGSTLGTVNVVRSLPRPTTVNSSIAVITPHPSTVGAYLHYLFQSSFMKDTIQQIKGGMGVPHLFQEDLNKFWIPLPQISEQLNLATFLDRETGKIDVLVEEQQRLIELLKEKRQAVISHAVTKGLNPGVPMKDSGIEWLGKVPAHWRVGKCGFYLRILSGFAFPSTGFTENENDTKLLRGINVGVSRLRWDETVYWQRTKDDGLDSYEMQAGDVVIGMDRPLISGGVRVAKVKGSDLPCLLLQRVASLKATERLNADYLLNLLSSEMFAAHFSPETTGVSVPHISPEQIYNFVIPVPPAPEQETIVKFVEAESARLGSLTMGATHAIDLLEERRTALISAAVTGKIDVRGLGTEDPA
jgi:type I restriction enzyme S subunit